MQQEPILPAAPNSSSRPTPIISRPPNESKRSFLPTLAILIGAPLVALFLTMFVFQSYEVDGPSMETSLQHQDRLIVWKLPRSIARITGNAYIPKRGDIIIFVKHGLTGSAGDKQLIKRVIGVPGDRVNVHDGKITLYTKDRPEGYNPDVGEDYSEHIAQYTSGNRDVVVGDDEVFVCGDNRSNSLDSREFGTVQATDIVGKLTFRILPANKFQSFL